MAEINGGGLIAKVLKQECVDTLFGLCGGHIDPIFQACTDEGMKVIGVRHEQAAVFMAEGHAWMTGKPGVVAVTAGPGVINAVTGLWTAMGRGAPIVVFGGIVHSEPFLQYLVSMFYGLAPLIYEKTTLDSIVFSYFGLAW